jgi:two-component system LytT family response regulator
MNPRRSRSSGSMWSEFIFSSWPEPSANRSVPCSTWRRIPSIWYFGTSIFTTAYSDYAVRSYDYDAVDYLLKPIEFERFMRAVTKALEFHLQRGTGEQPRHSNGAVAQNGSGNYLVVKSGTDYHKLQIDEILYIEAAGNYAVFVTRNANVMSLLSMKEVGSLLPPGRFFRIHKSYIVNFRHVSKIERDQVQVGTKLIPIGESFRESFLKAIQLTK